MRRAAGLVALALAGCGGGGDQPQGAATSGAAPVVATPAAPPAAPARQIGTVSRLRAETSALTGTVSGFAVEQTDFGTRVALAADTLFEFDRATITPAAEANLRRAADLVRQGGAGTVIVIGHTDAKGDDAYNADLSRRRAEAVAAWLRAQPGLGGRRFDALGKGEAEPVAPNAKPDGSDDPDGRARNRRVTVDIPK